jgi:hypothetical protein
VYETHKPAPINEKRVVEFDVSGPTPSEIVLKALTLWRPNMETGRPALPQPPIAQLPESAPSRKPAPAPVVNGEILSISRSKLFTMPDGELILCSSHPDGVEFLKIYNAWGFIRISRTPKSVC